MSTDINPNTPVTNGASDGVELSNADGGPSFDELEAQFLNPEHRVRTPKREKADSGKSQESKKEVKVEDTKEDDPSGKTKDLRPDAKAKESKAEDKKETKETEKDGKEKAEKMEKQLKKMLKARLADKELELDEETDVFVKINGEEVPVKMSELTKNYSGKTVWEKKFTEVDNQRRQVKGAEQRLDQMKSQIKEAMTEKDANIRLFKMAHLAGVDAVTFRNNFIAEMSKDVEEWLSMSDEERKAKDLEFENKYLKYNYDQAQQTQKAQQTQRELETKLKGLLQKTGIEPTAFAEKYEELSSYTDREKQALEQMGKFVNGTPTPEFIVETIQKTALWDAAKDALEGVKLSWTPNEKAEKLYGLVESAFADGISPKDIPDIVSEVWGKGRAKKVVEEAEKERNEHYEGRKEVPSHTHAQDEVWNFEQIL